VKKEMGDFVFVYISERKALPTLPDSQENQMMSLVLKASGKAFRGCLRDTNFCGAERDVMSCM